MQCFLFLVTLCQELEQIICRFWWKNSKTRKEIHWCDWKTFYLSKSQGWKLIMNPCCLLARVMQAKYYSNSDFLRAKLGSHPSYTWRSI